jgi:hypothetical protein
MEVTGDDLKRTLYSTDERAMSDLKDTVFNIHVMLYEHRPSSPVIYGVRRMEESRG